GKIDEVGIAFVVRSLEPFECAFFVSETCVNRCDEIWRNVSLLRQFYQLVDDLMGFILLAQERMSPRAAYERPDLCLFLCMRLRVAELGDGLFVLSGDLVGLTQKVVRDIKVGIQLDRFPIGLDGLVIKPGKIENPVEL